jgi:hypothetical protein
MAKKQKTARIFQTQAELDTAVVEARAAGVSVNRTRRWRVGDHYVMCPSLTKALWVAHRAGVLGIEAEQLAPPARFDAMMAGANTLTDVQRKQLLKKLNGRK